MNENEPWKTPIDDNVIEKNFAMICTICYILADRYLCDNLEKGVTYGEAPFT